jgi:transcription elongation factor Elf1
MWEQEFLCPFCWAEVSVLLDPSVGRNEYVEDCEVCCRPLEFKVSFEEGALVSFEVGAMEQ